MLHALRHLFEYHPLLTGGAVLVVAAVFGLVLKALMMPRFSTPFTTSDKGDGLPPDWPFEPPKKGKP